MLDGVANGDTESEEKNLGDSKEGRSKNDVTEGPAVIESTEDKNELRHNINHSTDERP